jgi:hypothetical protein
MKYLFIGFFIAGLIAIMLLAFEDRPKLKCIETNRGTTLICTHFDGTKTVWREDR